MRLLFLLIAFGISVTVPSTPFAQQNCDSGLEINAQKQFTDNGDGSVIHVKSGLVWKRCSEGQIWDGMTCNGAPKRFNFSQAVSVRPLKTESTNMGWRLPNIGELLSLTESRCTGPSIDLTIFPNTIPERYWSSSTSANTSNHAWYVYFFNAYANSQNKSATALVRLVRNND